MRRSFVRAIPCFVVGALSIGPMTGCGDDGVVVPDAFFPMVDGGQPDAPPTDAPIPETCTPETMGSTIGDPCDAPADCNDLCFCNGLEECVAGTCQVGEDPCRDAVDCTADSCAEESDRCTHDPQHEMCADEDACNGAETCDISRGCLEASPLYCNDEDSCTVDSCDTAAGCAYEPRDLDGDGYISGSCGGEDCDDDPRFGTMIYPGAPEDCMNRRDDDCNGLRDYNDAACVPTNGSCATAVTLPGPGTYSGSTRSLPSTYTLSCGSGTGPNAVFRFTLPEMRDVRITVNGGGSGVRVALRAFAMCAAGPDEKCSNAAPPLILRRSLPPGDYAIIVQSTSFGAAPFDLNMMWDAPTPIPPVDRCNAMTEDVSAGGVFTGMFAEVEDDYVLSCHSTGGTMYKDVAYRFTITTPKDVTIVANTTGAMWTPSTYLSLVTNCADTGSTVQCVATTSPMIRRRSLAPGTYYILVESSALDATMWDVTVTITDPVPRLPGDACTSALNITSARQSVPVATAEDDGGNSCSPFSTVRRDAFFYFDLTTTRDVTLTTESPSTQYVSVGTMCGVIGSEVRCRSGSTSFSQLFRSLAPGRYYVTVATLTTFGDLAASITTAPPTPVPPNDVCGGAIEIGGGYSRTDTLVDFEDEVAGCSGTLRPDAFYRLTLATSRRVSITATPVGSATTLYLTLRDVCGPGTNIACGMGAGATPAAISQTLAAGTYYLIVEAPTLTTGTDFRLDVATFPP